MDELLHKYFANTLADEDKQVLFDALEKDSALMDEFVRIQNTVAVSGMMKSESDDDWSQLKLKEVLQKARFRKNRRFTLSILRYAAVAAVLVSVWLFSDYYHTKRSTVEYTYIEVPKGQRVTLTLPDGSQAFLNSRSKLKFSNQFNHKNRKVELDGEGFFSVQKNTEIPFIVSAGEYNVEVTGTQFNVFAYSESDLFETDLVNGSVFIYKSSDESQKLYLSPEEKAYLADGQLHKTASRFIQTQRLQDGIYSFESNSFQEIINKLSLWYDVRFEVRNPEIRSYVFSGKFRQSDSINQIMLAIKETGKFNYTIVGEDKIEIY